MQYNMAPQELLEKLDRLPRSPGVYIFRNDQGRIIYIGKAKVLRNRVRSYFLKGSDGRSQFERLTRAIRDVEVIVTDNELEAMILEASMVRRHAPRYNVTLRDDKSMPYVKVTNELYPRIYLSRRPTQDGSRYYGPFANVQHMKRLLNTLKRIAQIRLCNWVITEEAIAKQKFRTCIYYEMGQCSGACQGKISPEEYSRNVERFLDFLKGRTQPLREHLTREMEELAQRQEYERAANLRDQLKALEQLSMHQKVISPVPISRDVAALAKEEDDACCVLFRIRDGKLVGRNPFFLRGVGSSTDGEILQAFLQQVYLEEADLPDELHLPAMLPDLELFRQWLTGRKGKKVTVEFPKIGEKAKLMKLARENAVLLLGERRLEVQRRAAVPEALRTLKEQLRLPQLPRRIEAFDVSNLHGQDAVASMVAFHDARPRKSDYRHFKIRTIEGIDDFAMMAEVIGRRYRRLKREEKPLPDLILIDGGKGQLSAAKQVLDSLERSKGTTYCAPAGHGQNAHDAFSAVARPRATGPGRRGRLPADTPVPGYRRDTDTSADLSKVPVIGLAKRLEEIFVPGDSEPWILPKTSSALKLLQHIRNEAHRFAIQHHRALRGKRVSRSELDNVPGIGEARRLMLLRYFRSLKRLKSASVDEIASLPGISRHLAEDIAKHLSSS